MSLSKNKIKYIRSLDLKKHRKAEGVFLAEGPKLVGDLLGHFHCVFLAATPDWIRQNPHIAADEVVETTHEELSRASLLKTPQEVLAVFEQKPIAEYKENEAPAEQMFAHLVEKQLCLALDDVQDPGNLGTIVRLADWFGIGHIFCSTGTADIFNPKTVQATMGALARVRVHYTDLPTLIGSLPSEVPVYATLLDGDNLYTQPLSAEGLIVMGNEGKGISPEVRQLINRKLFIPNYPVGSETSESLNVAIATAIVCAEFRRQSTIHP